MSRLLAVSLFALSMQAVGAEPSPGRVTGIGGVFFLADEDGASLRKWYEKHLGLRFESWGGVVFSWPEGAQHDGGLTVWHAADGDSDWFKPSTSRFMINYRVDDMAALISRLRSAGIEPIKGPETHENGEFAWIMDPDGNKVELWEPHPFSDETPEN